MTRARSGPIAPTTDLRRAMARFATGVAVITTSGPDGAPVGTTANAVSSLSLDPPLLLVCFARGSLTLGAVLESGVLAVNVLAHEQRHLSDAFARRGDCDAWPSLELLDGTTGAPLIAGCASNLDCTVERTLPGGDHEIVLGRVVATTVPEQRPAPLLFHDGAYATC